MLMAEVKVTRGSQITLTQEVREKIDVEEGDKVVLNVLDGQIMVSKKDPEAFETEGFLPEDFEQSLREMRRDSRDRLERSNE
jgi:AbrB family looped-hinge helix DNA binding protein